MSTRVKIRSIENIEFDGKQKYEEYRDVTILIIIFDTLSFNRKSFKILHNLIILDILGNLDIFSIVSRFSTDSEFSAFLKFSRDSKFWTVSKF